MDIEPQEVLFSFTASTLEDTQSIAKKMADKLVFPSCVYLNGGMGSGKTTLSKSIIRALGYKGEVTSPTYNLIQEYQVEQGIIYHMDLYRIEDPSELEYLALEDLWSETSLFLVEWPQKGAGYLQGSTAEIYITKQRDGVSSSRLFDLKMPRGE